VNGGRRLTVLRVVVAMLTAPMVGLSPVAAPLRAVQNGPPATSPGRSTVVNPGDLEAAYAAGVEAFRAGRVYEALERLGEVERRQPAYRDVQLLLGQACLVADLIRSAQRHFQTALDADPANAHAAFLLGLTLFRAARYVEANEILARAETLAPTNPHPVIYRGRTLLALGRPGEAKVELDLALALAPEEPTAWSALAELDLAGGRLQAAEGRARGVIQAGGKSAEDLLLLGRIVLTDGRASEAVPILRRALALSPDRADGLYLLAQALLRSGETEEGQRVLQRFRERKGLEEAIRVAQSDLNRRPDDVDVRFRVAYLLLEFGDAGAAGLQLSTLLRQAPGDARIDSLKQAIEHSR